MLNPIEINFKLDKTIKRSLTTELMIKSHDINVIEFHISFDGLELTADHTVKVLSVFNDTKSQTNVICDIVDGKAIYRPDTSIISQYEYAQNYVYLYHGDQSVDVRLFTYIVDSSEIDKTAIKVKTVYDQSYAEMLTEFEARLQDYKDSLPQASDLRAEVDVILNKFKTDSDAKLSQYDADAQQVIADNQTAFGVAESGRQDAYEQAEDSRNQASNQAVVDFVQTANAQKDAKLSEIQADADSTINQFKQDGANEIVDWRGVADAAVNNFNQNGDAEIADWREGADVELEDYLADRVVLNNLIVNGNFDNTSNWNSLRGTAIAVGNELQLTGNGSGVNSAIQQISKPFLTTITGHKIYTCAIVRVSNSLAMEVSVETQLGTLLKSSKSSPLANTDYILSGVGESSGITNLEHIARMTFASTANNNGSVMTVKKFTSINLTSTFGAGNEPTKAEMDELIKITGYFDEITLTQKQLLNWQLKLMRQNRNALIELGGTII